MADDRLGFEKHDRAVADHRHQTHRVELEEGLVVQPSERAADGMPLKLDPGLSRGPQYFDNIERIPPTPKRDHACLRVEGKESWGAVILTGTAGGQGP
jgi:hypothetical protein